MSRENLLKDVVREHVEDRVPAESIEYLTIFLHEEGSVVDDRSSKEFLEDKFEFVLSLSVYLYDTVLKEVKVRCVISRCLKDVILVVFLGFKVVNDVMERLIIDILEVLHLFERIHDEHLNSVLVRENMFHQLLL